MNLNETSVFASPEVGNLHICRLQGLVGGNWRGGAVSRATIKGGPRRLIAWHSLAVLHNYQDISLPQIDRSIIITSDLTSQHSDCQT